MGKLRCIGQYLGLVYRDDGSWRLGSRRVEDPSVSIVKPISDPSNCHESGDADSGRDWPVR